MTGQEDEAVGNGAPVEERKLTNWKREPSIRDLKSDYEAAEPSHSAFTKKLDRWQELMRCTGSARPKKQENRSAVQPKLIRRQAEWRYAPLSEPFLSSHKIFQVKPRTFEDVKSAEQNELVLNWQMRTKFNLVQFIDEYVRSGVDEGTVFVRTGWNRVTEDVEEEVPVFSYFAMSDQEQLNEFKQWVELKLANPREFDETASPEIAAAVEYFEESGEATVAKQTGTTTAQVEKIVENHPEAVILNPRNVVIDPSCEGDIDKAKFALISFETCKADLEKEGDRYKNLDRVNWKDATPPTEETHSRTAPSDFQFKDGPRKRVIAHEYWGFYDVDGSGKLMPIVATWIGDTIIRMEENPFPDKKIPLVVVPYLPVKRELVGEPDAELLEDNQAVLGALMRGMIDLMGRSANSQQGFAKGWLDPLNKRKFLSGEDYEYNPQLPPEAAHHQHKYPELPQSGLIMSNMMNQEAEALTGVKSFAGGISGEAYGEVAAGIRGVLDAASKRELAILRRFAQGIIAIGRKFIAMNAVFLSEEEVIRVTNQEFVTVKREDLVGEFDLITDISTAEMDNQQAQDLSFMLQTTGPDMDPTLRNRILAKIADLKRMPDLAEELRTYEPKPDPVAQKLQELEIAKLEREIAKLEAQIAETQAQADERRAKTQNIEAETLSDVSGVKHGRDLEKQKAQSDGNRDLEVTKALTRPKKPDERDPDIEAAVGFNQLSDQLNEEV